MENEELIKKKVDDIVLALNIALSDLKKAKEELKFSLRQLEEILGGTENISKNKERSNLDDSRAI